MPDSYYVYIRASKSRVLYIGITSNLERCVWEHKNDYSPGFTRDYRLRRLVHFEKFKYVNNAIKREKQLKGWVRRRKTALIESVNPTWEDLAEECFKPAPLKQVLRAKNARAQDDNSLEDVLAATNSK
jgi:putative endonuclease